MEVDQQRKQPEQGKPEKQYENKACTLASVISLMTSMVKYIKTQVPHFESQTHRQILPMTFPKYEVTPHLLKLQFKNPDFVETFLLQLLIMIDCLQHPIKDQKRTIKISDAESPELVKLVNSIVPVLEQIDKVKLTNTKMKFQTS